MANSLESACEKFFVELFKADPRSAGKSVVQFDEESKAKSKSIVVRAVQGGHNLAGFGGYDLEISVEYRSPIGTSKAENDLASKMLNSIVYESTILHATRAAMATAAGLSDLLIKDEAAGNRENTENLRKRSITLPVQAKLA